MYHPVPTLRERAGPLVAVLLIHVGIGYGLLNLTGAGAELARRSDLEIFDVLLPASPPPPPPPPPIVEQQPAAKQARAKEAQGAASPKNIKSKATPVVAPQPRILVPTKSAVVAATTPGVGANATSGASDVRGPGTGAGGTGNGTGSGGSGNGSGGGGNGGGGPPSRPTVIEGSKLTSSDYPTGAIRAWPRGARVDVAVRVQLDGRGTDCKVNRSSGNRGIDADTCRLVMAKVRFNPARDERGRPYVDWYGYRQEPAGRW